MRVNSHTMQVVGQERAISNDASSGELVRVKKEKGVFGKVRDLISKVVWPDEDWFLRSEDWPYLWRK